MQLSQNLRQLQQIHRGIKRDDRLVELNKIAKRPMQTLQMSKLIELNMPENK